MPILAVSRLHLIDPSSIEHKCLCFYWIFVKSKLSYCCVMALWWKAHNTCCARMVARVAVDLADVTSLAKMICAAQWRYNITMTNFNNVCSSCSWHLLTISIWHFFRCVQCVVMLRLCCRRVMPRQRTEALQAECHCPVTLNWTSKLMTTVPALMLSCLLTPNSSSCETPITSVSISFCMHSQPEEMVIEKHSLPSNRRHLSFDDRLEVTRENN